MPEDFNCMSIKKKTEVFNKLEVNERIEFLNEFNELDRSEFISQIRNQAVADFWFHEQVYGRYKYTCKPMIVRLQQDREFLLWFFCLEKDTDKKIVQKNKN